MFAPDSFHLEPLSPDSYVQTQQDQAGLHRLRPPSCRTLGCRSSWGAPSHPLPLVLFLQPRQLALSSRRYRAKGGDSTESVYCSIGGMRCTVFECCLFVLCVRYFELWIREVFVVNNILPTGGSAPCRHSDHATQNRSKNLYKLDASLLYDLLSPTVL